jgi:hypothetical protein
MQRPKKKGRKIGTAKKGTGEIMQRPKNGNGPLKSTANKKKGNG